MTFIEGEITIARPAETVFDFAADQLTFAPVPGGTRMRWAWVVRPKGTSRLLTPVISWIGRRQEPAIWTGMKRYLEAHPQSGRDE
jgi:hypothetical protein